MKEHVYPFLFLIGLLTMIIKRITFEKEKGKEYTSPQQRVQYSSHHHILSAKHRQCFKSAIIK